MPLPKRTVKKMRITIIAKQGDVPQTKTISILEFSELYIEIQKLINKKTDAIASV